MVHIGFPVSFIVLVLIASLFESTADQQHIEPLAKNNKNKNDTATATLNKLILKKLSPFLEENSIIEELLFPEKDFRCGSVVNFTVKYGFVKNPEYPNEYKVPVFCQWNIVGKRDEIITISIDELDIENPKEHSLPCLFNPHSKECCVQNYLKIGSSSHEQYFCGKLSNEKTNVYISQSNLVSVTFNATTNRNKAAGFYFSYFITSKFSYDCYHNEFRCNNGKCIPKKWTCNQKLECGDGSDELLCDIFSETIPCGDDSTQHFHITQRCDRRPDCKNMADEHDCDYCDSDHFRCMTVRKCINQTLLCNGIPDCQDYSDETAIECRQYCPANKIRCGTMAHCYDPKLQRCNKILDCPNGADEWNCFDHCQGKIMCASGDGCYDLNERCNGIVQCADYSDEKNCTLELCRPDKGSFLCTNGRCIPSIWACDRSADCFDASDEMQCLKNSVITAAIIGCLICGLLIVIAISCGCKLLALRHLEQYRASIAHSGATFPTPFRDMEHFAFPNPGDLDASLFRMQHSVLFREPPPSYASAMGGYHDVNHSYMEQYRRYRRQRRCRRMMRRQHRNQPSSAIGGGEPTDTGGMTIITNHHHHHHHRDDSSSPNETTIGLSATNTNNAEVTYFPLNTNNRHHHGCNNNNNEEEDGDEENKDNDKKEMQPDGNNTTTTAMAVMIGSQTETATIPVPTGTTTINNSHHHHPTGSNNRNISMIHVTSPPPPPPLASSSPSGSSNHSHSPNVGDNLNIELEPIISALTNFDCDSQPLIR